MKSFVGENIAFVCYIFESLYKDSSDDNDYMDYAYIWDTNGISMEEMKYNSDSKTKATPWRNISSIYRMCMRMIIEYCRKKNSLPEISIRLMRDKNYITDWIN